MVDEGAIHIRKVAVMLDSIRSTGDTCLMMVIGSGCPGLATEMPKLLDRLSRTTTHQTMLVFQDGLEHLEGAREKAKAWGWKDRIYALDQEECGCYMDVRERNRIVLDALDVKRSKDYHLATSLLLLIDPQGNVLSSSQYLEYPLRDKHAK
jgi:hypothetical protein